MKPELLAPAGGWEQLEYAIRFGADAVYLATDRFGMRQRAANFRIEDLPRVCSYAHERGVRVYLACNIVMHDDDFDVLPGYFEALVDAGADAAIVSDLGAFQLARQVAPSLELHVSTQASVSNTQAALAWYALGARRIVLARELSVRQIAAIRAGIPQDLELEAFVHGSMCMSYSGRCMISDYLTGRSSSGGHCTQPCRWHYALMEDKRPGEYFPVEEDGNGTYILNSKDLNMLAHLDDLRDTGVFSFKIEGRNKNAFYVGTVVNAYRRVMDGADPASIAPELEVFNHRPYSTGFYYGPAHQAPESDKGIQLYEWVAEVVSCRPLATHPGTSGTVTSGTVASGAMASGTMASGAMASGTMASGTTSSGAMGTMPQAQKTPGSDAQPLWLVTARCRNRFAQGSELEVLSPGVDARHITPLCLERAYDSDNPDGPDSLWIPEAVANRAMELYRFVCSEELRPYDIVRSRTA